MGFHRSKNGQRGALSTLLFLNSARMGSYAEVLNDPTRYHNSVVETRQEGRLKYGIALSLEQQIRHGTGTLSLETVRMPLDLRRERQRR